VVHRSTARPQPKGTPHPITPFPSSLSLGEREEGEGSSGEGPFLNEGASGWHPTAVPRSRKSRQLRKPGNAHGRGPQKQGSALLLGRGFVNQTERASLCAAFLEVNG
jgi:hypothetical protein